MKRIMCLALSLILLGMTPANAATAAPKSEEKLSKIVFARPSDSDNLDPVTQSHNENIWVLNLMMDGLVKSSNDGSKVEPNLATKWDVSADGTQYTFHLLEGVKFSDGTPVTTDDWIWSLLRARDEPTSIWGGNLKAIADVTAPDSKTIVVTLKHADAAVLAALAMFNASVLPKAYFEKVTLAGFTQAPIGTGPYMLKEWVKGDHLTLRKNPFYRVEGLPQTDEIAFNVVPDDNTRMLQLEAGAIDGNLVALFNKMAALKDDPTYTVENFPGTLVRFLVFNTARAPFNDVRVRQAIAYAIDKKAIVQVALNGYGELGTAFMHKSLMYHNPDLPLYQVDVEKAKKLLAEAGLKAGTTVEFLIRSGDNIAVQVATLIQANLSKVGITVKIVQMEAASVSSLQRSFQFDMSYGGWTSDMIDPAQAMERFVNYNDTTRCYYTGWRNEEAIKLVADALRELNPEKRRDIYYKVQKIYADECPAISLFYGGYPVILRAGISGFVQTPLGNYRFENLVKK